MLSRARAFGRMMLRILLLLVIFGVFAPNFTFAQSCSISISPQTGVAGSGRTLYWSVSDYVGTLDISGIGRVVTTCYASGEGNGGCTMPPVSGSLGISPSYSTTYTGTAVDVWGTDTYCSDTAYATPAYSQASYYAQSYYQSSYYSPASCSVSLSPNPKSYAGSATLSWSSSQAHYWVYINNVGYVGGSGSISVSPSSSTDYSCYANGYGGSDGWHSYTLTVNPPANCSFNGSTVNHGSSVTAYQAATVPYGQSCASQSQSRSCSNGTLSGTYQYESCTVDNPAPTCSIAVAPTTITSGESSTLTWSSSNATTCTGTNFSTGGATSGSTSVSPSSSTNYSASCTGTGGTTACTDTSSGGGGDTTATLSVACTESWACTGSPSNTITHTLANCSTETVDTCVTPEFCTTGSATCLYNAVSGSISASPRLVRSGATTQVSWSTDDASSCTVTGNGDTWTGTTGSQTSSPITELTTYTIHCDDGDPDSTQDDFTDRVIVVRLPGWLEL
ncbi:hypothetical protein HY969_03255 [Candidatus Kaiserbacteria bacterium]|nr:hypothetical protein [Candidatus Kaiserbacteria bacterium]